MAVCSSDTLRLICPVRFKIPERSSPPITGLYYAAISCRRTMTLHQKHSSSCWNCRVYSLSTCRTWTMHRVARCCMKPPGGRTCDWWRRPSAQGLTFSCAIGKDGQYTTARARMIVSGCIYDNVGSLPLSARLVTDRLQSRIRIIRSSRNRRRHHPNLSLGDT